MSGDDGKISRELEPPADLRPAETPSRSGSSAEDFRSDVERDRELFCAVAETRSDLVRTLSLLVTELADCALPPEQQRGLGGHLQRLGQTLTMRADRLTIDISPRAAQPGPVASPYSS